MITRRGFLRAVAAIPFAPAIAKTLASIPAAAPVATTVLPRMTGITPAANFIPSIWARELSDATRASVLLSNLVDRKFESEMNYGDVIRITNLANDPDDEDEWDDLWDED